MLRRGLINLLLCLGISLSAGLGASEAFAGPKEDAAAMFTEGKTLLEKGKAMKASNKKRQPMLVEGLRKTSRAYLLLAGQNLQEEAGDLWKQINAVLTDANQIPQIATMRRELLTQAIDATITERFADAYDQMSNLRDLDPRDPAVEYALGVISQRM